MANVETLSPARQITHTRLRTALFVNTQARRGAKHFADVLHLLHAAGITLDYAAAVENPEMLASHVEHVIAAGIDRVIIGGGDGTLSRVVCLFAHQNVTLGVLPLGTGNYLARTLGIPMNLKGAVHVIAQGNMTRIDLGRANDHDFINTLSIGLSDDVAHAANRTLKHYLGFAAYGVAVLKVLPWHHHFYAHLESDEMTCDARTHQLVVANGTYVGEHLRAGPGASIEDGKLIVFTLEGQGRFDVLRGAFSVAIGRHATDPQNHYFETQAVCVTTNTPQRVTLDGEDGGFTTPVNVHVEPKALRVIASADYIARNASHGPGN